VRGVHRLILDLPERAKQLRRQVQDELNYAPTLAFVAHTKKATTTSSDKGAASSFDMHDPRPNPNTNPNPKTLKWSTAAAPATFSLLAQEFPPNVRLVTLTNNYASFHNGKLLLRIAHRYSKGEHAVFSKPATVVLDTLFGKVGVKVMEVEEVSLTGNQSLRAMDASKFNWSSPPQDSSSSSGGSGGNDKGNGKDTRPGGDHRMYGRQTEGGFKVTLRPMEVRTFLIRLQGNE
jgi:hypothetical protein